MKKVLLPGMFTLVIVILITSPVWTQLKSTATISGRIVDAKTKEPLVFVNVFIANTTIGTTTNENGFYLLENVNLGNNNLVISMMGFEVESREIFFSQSSTRTLNFQLRSKILKMPSVEIEAMDAKEWRRNLKIFKREFLGQSNNAEKCEILNPEILNFRFEKESGILNAFADEPLVIMNNALGYKIYVILSSFVLSGESCQYIIMPHYEKLLPKDEKEENNWRKNRIKAYNGSFRHFVVALTSAEIREHGFALWGITDSRERIEYPLNDPESINNLMTPGDFEFEIKLHCEDLLRVEYLLESNEFSKSDIQVSYLELKKDTVTVSQFGYVTEYNSIFRSGRWYYDRMSDALPNNYNVKR